MIQEKDILSRHLAFWRQRAAARPLMNTVYPSCSRMELGILPVPANPAKTPRTVFFEEVTSNEQVLTPGDLDPAALYASLVPASGDASLMAEDLFLTISPLFKPLWLNGIIGCSLVVQKESMTVWAKPYLTEQDLDGQLPEIPFVREWLDKFLQFTEYLAEHFHPAHMIAHPFLRSPGDLLSNILGLEAMILGMMSHPEKIHELLERLTDIFIEVVKAQLAIIPRVRDGYCNMYGLWSPGTTVGYGDHVFNLLSPDLFEQFIRPCHEKITKSFDYSFVHLHVSESNVVDLFLSLEELGAVEVAIDPPPFEPVEMLPVLQKIHEKKPLIVTGELSRDSFLRMQNELDPAGLLIDAEIRAEND